MPLYEVLLVDSGPPEVRLTDQPLAVGDVVDIANRAYQVERTVAPTREDAELRYVLVRKAHKPFVRVPTVTDRPG